MDLENKCNYYIASRSILDTEPMTKQDLAIAKGFAELGGDEK